MEKTLQFNSKIVLELDDDAYDEFREIAFTGTRLLINMAHDDRGNEYSIGETSKKHLIVFFENFGAKEFHKFQFMIHLKTW